MEAIKIRVVTYRLATKSAEYKELAAALKARGLHHFEVWHTREGKEPADGVYTVEAKHLFSDQTNTAEGFRIFDWYDGLANPERTWRIGHYCVADEGFAALQKLRRETVRCGYCGFQCPAEGAPEFHHGCLSSEHLKEDDLRLLRFVNVADGLKAEFPALTEGQRAELFPIYRDAQIHGNDERSKARVAKMRADLLRDFESETQNARAKFEGYTWLLNHGVNTANAIYYNHTRRFSFGWREPLSDALMTALLKVLAGFPFPFEIKRAPSRKAPTMSRGTAHFVSTSAAIRYYSAQGLDAEDVARKAAEGEIHLGVVPEMQPGEVLAVIDEGTRYAIEEPSR